MSDVSFMTSNKGGRILIHNDFIYRKAKTSDIRTYWRCSTSSCKATLLTENDILKKTSLTQHNHTSHSNKIKRKHFYSELKKDAGRSNVSVPKLYKVHIAKAQLNDEESSSYLPCYSTAKRIVYNSLKARRSCNLENLEGIELDRNRDSPDNKDILLISSVENDKILTHCTEPISKSLEAERSHNPGNLEGIKLERNGDSPNNKDILLISNVENDKILTHCTEPISKSLEAERSHNPGNLEGIKLERNSDSPNNKDILRISNDENDKILTHCTEPISKSFEAERSHNPGSLEGIKLERNGDSPDNKDILLITNDKNDKILTHCTEPISKSFEAERSHNPGSLEGIKLERNGDSPDNKDILLITNDKNDKILTHCTEPISKSLEAERSHNPGNVEGIKLERNGDSLYNGDILLISNYEKDKILTHCTEPISKSLDAEKSHNPGNLEGIKLDRNGDSSNNKDILLISSDENDRILKMFPVGTKIIDCDFSSEKDYTAELRLKCKSKEEFKLWLRDFENISGDTYRVAKTVPREGKVVLYKAAYRCHHNTYPFSHRVVKAPSKKHTDCAATLNVTIKAFVPGRRNRSRDTLVADYPTIVRIRHNHNHDIDVVKAVEYRNLEENVDSSWHLSLLLGKDQAKPEAKNQSNFVKIESIVSMCGEQPDTGDEKPVWEELMSGASMCGEQPKPDDEEPVWEELVSGTSMCGEQPDSDEEEPVWEEMESHDGMCDEEPDSEDEEAEWEEMESCVGVCGEQPDSGNKEQKREEMELLLNEITAIFKAKFEKSPRDFSDALSSMHKSIRTMKFADLLSAMHNFGKIHYKTITCQSLCNDQSIHKKNFILGTNQSVPKMPIKSTYILKHDYSV